MSLFRPATRHKTRLRMAIDGPSGSGKTFTALRFALALGKKVAVINSESGAVEKYLGLAPDGIPFQFDVCELDDFAPTKYTESILGAGAAGYDVLVIDSLSHAWAGSGGALELKDRKGGNSFTAWKDITPMHNQMIEAILRSPCHVIATMRSKTEHVIEQDGYGKTTVRKVGMAPVQRAGMEYEFDVYCSIDSEHILKVSKSRCPEVADAMTVKPGMGFIEPVVKWLNDGSDAPAEMFAVTADDLARMTARKEGEKAQPAAAKKTAMELVKEAAAKDEVKPEAKQAEVKQETKPPADNSDLVVPDDLNQYLESTPEQRSELAMLYERLGVTQEQQQAILAKRGLSVVRSLSYEQADEIIEKLKEKLAAIPVEERQPEGESLAGVVSQKTDGPCTDEQVARIKNALAEWEQQQPGVCGDFIARLNGAGFVKIADLNFEQARTLLADIEAKAIANFFDSQLQAQAAG